MMEKPESERPSKRQAVGSSKPKPLNSTRLEQQLWLVKIPTFVSEQWSKSKHDDVLGSFMVGMVPGNDGKPPTKQLIVKLNEGSDRNSSSVPQSFTLDETTSAQNVDSMIAFSSDSATENFAVDGKITKSLVMRPQRSSDYTNLVRERGLQKLASRREAQSADMKNLQKAAEQNQTVEFIYSTKADLKVKAAKMKSGTGEELDEAALKSKVFEAFEKSERLTMKQLMEYCKNVKGFSRSSELSRLLDRYATFHTKGPHKATYELLREYLPTASASTASASALS